MLQKKKILDIRISIGSYNEFVNSIVKLAKTTTSNYVCVVNVHMTVEAHDDKDFCSIVNNATIATPDGMPLVIALNKFYDLDQRRVAGMDLFPDLLKVSEKEGLRVFFYGSTNEVLEAVQNKAKKLFPNLQIAGSFSPPFRPLTPEEKKHLVEEIRSVAPNLIFVSLGCPKQERWMAEMHHKINATMIGVGGAFPIFAELQKRAPVWMQRLSLEWLYRLLQEPKRLFRRYAYTNIKFLFLIIYSYFKTKLDLLSSDRKRHL